MRNLFLILLVSLTNSFAFAAPATGNIRHDLKVNLGTNAAETISAWREVLGSQQRANFFFRVIQIFQKKGEFDHHGYYWKMPDDVFFQALTGSWESPPPHLMRYFYYFRGEGYLMSVTKMRKTSIVLTQEGLDLLEKLNRRSHP